MIQFELNCLPPRGLISFLKRGLMSIMQYNILIRTLLHDVKTTTKTILTCAKLKIKIAIFFNNMFYIFIIKKLGKLRNKRTY